MKRIGSAKSDNTGKSKVIFVIIMVTIIAFLISCGEKKEEEVSDQVKAPETEDTQSTETEKVINYNSLQKDSDMMQERKANLGVEKGVDLIVKSEESLRIGNTTVSMQEIIDKINQQSGKLIETEIGNTRSSEKSVSYGIHVVVQNDNIWNIHFGLLKDYFNARNISLSPMSDEPDQEGYSSGVGKLLKFSEKLAYIYNLKERRLDINVDTIIPMSKVVVYNMDRVFNLLDNIDYTQIDSLRFDGKTLWLPAEE